MHLPDDILDLVFEAVDTTPDEEPTPEIEVKWTWQACALVSRRWYNIVIPRLFRSITVGRLARELATALASNPPVAELVREVFIFKSINVQVLDKILHGLPYIRLLKVPPDFNIFLYPGCDTTSFLRHHVIEVLQFGNYVETGWPEPDGGTFPTTRMTNLLNLFMRIEHLDISFLPDDEWDSEFDLSPTDLAAMVRSAVADSCTNGLEVRKLSCGTEDVATRFMPRYLLDIGACKYLTVLKLELRDCHELTELCNLLLAVKDTLKVFWLLDMPEYFWSDDGTAARMFSLFVNI